MKCPKCGEQLPLLSKVCPVCKTVVDKEDGVPDAVELASALDAETVNIKKLVHQAGQIRPGAYLWVYLLVAGCFLGLMAVKTGAGILWILALAVVACAIPAFIRSRKGGIAAQLAESKVAYEYGITLVKRYFKGSSEMSRFVEESNNTVFQAEEGIRSGRRRSLAVGLGIALAEVILCAVILAAVPSRQEIAEKKAQAALEMPSDYDGQVAWLIKNEQPEKAVETYLSSEYNDEFAGAAKRVELCEALCQAGYTLQAEDFVLHCCIGKMQDMDCAKAVVLSHIAAGEKEEAASFAAKCTGLRYKSDINKLKELIK